MVDRNRYLQYAWIAVFTGVLAWSAVDPHDYPTWWLEVLPALIGAALIWYTRDTFPLTPLFDQIAQLLGHTRNNYD